MTALFLLIVGLVALSFFPLKLGADRPELTGTETLAVVGGQAVDAKAGAKVNTLDPKLGDVVAALVDAGFNPVVTSGVRRNDKGSLHATGDAMDLRTRHLGAQERFRMQAVAGTSRPDVQAVLEQNPPHLHVEIDS